MKKIPVFPLPVILFPDAYLPLQIFELRYRRMVKQCLQDNSGFVVVQSIENSTKDEPGFFSLGCYGEILDWHPLPNEMIGIELKGIQKARIDNHAIEQDGLIIGEVELLADENHALISHRYEYLVQLLKNIQDHPLIAALPFTIDYNDATDVSFRLAEYLPFTPEEKQLMLEMDNAVTRLEMIISILRELP
ncbi:MAG: LON peptidase substrate-binding domain-containing protein [Amphritea sp.]